MRQIVRFLALPAAAALLLAGCSAEAPPAVENLQAAAAAPKVDVVELSIAQAQQGMAAGSFSSADLVDAYLARIAAIDDAGPRLGAVIALSADAREQAGRLDVERAAGRLRGPLHGIPVLVKDNIDVSGLPTTAGSLAMTNHRPSNDAFLVTRLREAGAVILGKTNLSEWANFRSTRSTSGWSSAGGQTRNPYVLDRTPCGSSSGTGAAIAASLATVGVGTETNGSILCPSAVSGLVGLKPTVGRVSRIGIVPISISQDTAGPMARSVADAALLMAALDGPDARDPAHRDGAAPDYAAAVAGATLAGRRIGVVRQAMGRDARVDALFETALEAMRAAGAEVVDPVDVPTWGQWGEAELIVLLHEFKSGLNDYLREGKAPHADLAALIAWNEQNGAEAMPWFGQELFEQAQATGGLDAPAYRGAAAKAKRLAGADGLLNVLAAQRLDALVAPTTGPAWPIDPVLGDRFGFAGYGIAAVAGTPSLTLPMGDVHGLPVGLTLLGAADSEAALLGMAQALEAALPARQPPQYRASLVP